MSVTRTRLDPALRREQLLDLGVQLLSGGRLDELSIDALAVEAGISRGLLYHYFSSKRGFHLAVLQRIADQVVAITAPDGIEGPLEQLAHGLAAYVDFVTENKDAYVSFVRGAASGDSDFHEIYERTRAALTDRIFVVGDPETLAQMGLVDTPAGRLVLRGWSALVEELLLTWLDDDHGISRERLLEMMVASLEANAGIAGATGTPR